MQVKIPIDKGSSPDIDPQINSPRLLNMIVGVQALHRAYSLDTAFDLADVQGIHFTNFEIGSYIVVTRTTVFRAFIGGGLVTLGDIDTPSAPVRMQENSQNQVIITTGNAAYVLSQQFGGLTKLGIVQGFDLINPIDIVVLNTFAVIVGGTDRKWITSAVNNALVYDANTVQVTDEEIGNLTAIGEMNNNLFIFGEFNIERWVPSIERTSIDFPFTKDPSYRSSFGCVATGSLVRELNVLYFLGTNNSIQMLSNQGLQQLSVDGISRTLDSYTEQSRKDARGVLIKYKGAYYYQLSFNEQSWIVRHGARTFSESDTNIRAGQKDLFADSKNLSLIIDANEEKIISLTTEIIRPEFKSKAGYRFILKNISILITEGKLHPKKPQHVWLEISKDNISFSNSVAREIGATGKRQHRLVWQTNISSQAFTFRFKYFNTLDISFIEVVAEIV